MQHHENFPYGPFQVMDVFSNFTSAPSDLTEVLVSFSVLLEPVREPLLR